MDSTWVSGTQDTGSIPVETTLKYTQIIHLQAIELVFELSGMKFWSIIPISYYFSPQPAFLMNSFSSWSRIY